jgi:hypothetical protein
MKTVFVVSQSYLAFIKEDDGRHEKQAARDSANFPVSPKS